MKRTIILIISLFLFINCKSKKENNDYLFIINFYGSKLKENPKLDSKTIELIKVGDSLSLIKKTNIKAKKSILNDSLFLKGFWSKVIFKNKIGYIFNGDYSKRKPILNKNSEINNNISASFLGKIIRKTDSIKEVKFGSKTYKIKNEYTFYKNCTYKYYVFDSCFNHQYNFINSTFNEVYHFMINNYITNSLNFQSKNDYNHPIFKNKKNNVFYFQELGASQDIKIEIKKSGIIVLSSYDCT